MSIDSFNPDDPRIQLLIAKEHLKHKDELNSLQNQLELKKQELFYLQEAIKRNKKSFLKKKSNARTHAIITSVLFLISTLLIGFGIAMLTTTNPNLIGWLMIILGSVTYLMGTIMTSILALGEVNE